MAEKNNRQQGTQRFVFWGLAAAFLAYSGFVYQANGTKTEEGPVSEMAIAGKHLWQKHNCGSCHQFYGLGGYLGPDLTNVVSAKGKGREYARAIMQSGTGVMPNFHLNAEELDQLLAFLEEVDRSGRGSVHDFTPQPDGTIEPKILSENE